jgi:RHS repeat-associated protein
MLSNSQVGTYLYDAVQPHAVDSTPQGSYSYDANGNMTGLAGDVLAYDGENRLKSVNGTAVQFVYGPDGARLKKIAGSSVTLYLGPDIERDPAGEIKRYYPGDFLSDDQGEDTLHRDRQGSMRAFVHNHDIDWSASYRPYGEQTASGSVDVSKGFVGERHDEETALLYLNARYYDPVIARFIQPEPLDPFLPGVGPNRYAYARNNPIMFADPSGLDPANHDKGSGRGYYGGGGGGLGGRGGNGNGRPYAHEIRVQAAELSDKQLAAIREALPELNEADAFVDLHTNTATVGGTVSFSFPSNATFTQIAARATAIAAQLTATSPGVQIAGPRESDLPSGWAIVARTIDDAVFTAELVKTWLNNEDYTTLQDNALTAVDVVGYAEALLGVLDDEIAQTERAVAILITKEGVVLVASGGRNLTAEQIQVAREWGMEPVTSGPVDLHTHAEVTVANMAYQAGLSPMAMGVSKDVCPACARDLRGRGAFVSGQIAAWP